MKKPIFRLVVVFFLLNAALHADWNRDFDEQSILLAEQLVPLQNADYGNTYHFFAKIRSKLLKDRELVQQIYRWKLDEKLMIKKPDFNVIVKKRRNNHFHDLYAWELSYVTGSNEYIVPSFPIEIGGKIAVVQHLENFEIGSSTGHPKKVTEKVSLITYWKALLQAYVLGLSDLVGQNIGVNEKGIIRFFDTEACYIYRNTPFKNEVSFKMGFQCQAIDWPQYSKPLSAKAAKAVQEYIESFSDGFEEKLKIYFGFRPFSFSQEGLQIRLDKIRNFEFREGVTFQDFYSYLYPRMSPGFDELSDIVSSILKSKKRVGHGTSLFFVTRHMKKLKLTNEERSAINQWVNAYID